MSRRMKFPLLLLMICAAFPPAEFGRSAIADTIPSTDSAFGVYMSHSLPQRFMQAEGLTEQEMFDWCDQHMAVLGAHWTRYSLLAAWQLIEPTLGAGYNWSADGPNGVPDTILGAVYAPGNDIHAVVNIQSLSLEIGTPTRSPFTNETEYRAFVQALAERYDGDGVDDAPGSIKVDYFQLANEVQDWFDRGLTADQYGEAAQITLDALRSVNPNAQIVMVGTYAEDTGGVLENRYKQAIQAMNNRGVKPAAIDIHWWYWTTASSDWQSPVITDARAYLDSIGWQDVQIWSMEEGAWSGCPANRITLTEEDQAVTLVKRYVWGRANGLDKLFWQGLIDIYNFNGESYSPFNSMGLVDDGEQNCSDITRRNTQRIAYWSYQKLANTTDNLVATPSGTVSGTHDGSSVFAYQYTNRSDSSLLYIVWREGSPGNVTLNVPGFKYHLTNLIPDRFGNFQESDLTAVSGTLTVSADDTPLLITAATDVAPDISASPSAKDFGSVNSGSSSPPQTFTITNNGTDYLNISGISLDGDDPGQFSLQSDGCTGHNMVPAESCNVQAIFSPTSGGLKKADLTIYSNDPDIPSLPIALQGTGVQYTLTVSGAAGSSSGTITGGNSIDCAVATDGSTSGTCTEARNPGTSILLTANPAVNAAVSWTNCPGSSGNTCTVTLNGEQTITAAFNETVPSCSNPVKIIRWTTAYYYSSIQSAYDNAADGDIIKTTSMDFTENLLLNRPVAVTVDGGYDCDFAAAAGSTALKGTLTITSGMLTANNLVVY